MQLVSGCTSAAPEYKDYKIVRLSLSGLGPIEHYSFGSYIHEISNRLDRKTVFIASGDLSHRLKDSGPYGYQKEGPEYDEKIMNIMKNADFEKLMEIVKQCQIICLREGAPSVMSYVKIAFNPEAGVWSIDKKVKKHHE
mgnify:CR=1 FL=1